MECPRLKAHFAVRVAADDRVFLLAENRHFLITGRGSAAVLPYLDGRHTIAQIAEAVSGDLSLPETLTAVRKYEAFGQLAEGRPELPDQEIAHWDALGLDPGAAKAALRGVTISLVALDGIPDQSVLHALTAEGMTVTRCGVAEAAERHDTLIVVLTGDYLHPGLGELDQLLAADPRPWLPARASGRSMWLGPLMEHGRTGCWACMAQRLIANRQVERYITGKLAGTRVEFPRAHLAAGPTVLAGLLATEIAAFAATGTAANIDGQIITIDLVKLATDEHVLVRDEFGGFGA